MQKTVDDACGATFSARPVYLTILEMSKLSATILHPEKYLAVPEGADFFYCINPYPLFMVYTMSQWKGGYF